MRKIFTGFATAGWILLEQLLIQHTHLWLFWLCLGVLVGEWLRIYTIIVFNFSSAYPSSSISSLPLNCCSYCVFRIVNIHLNVSCQATCRNLLQHGGFFFGLWRIKNSFFAAAFSYFHYISYSWWFNER